MGIKDIKDMMNRFSFSQMTSNTDGKTSASGTMGILICTIGSICFLLGTIYKNDSILLQSVVFTGIGAGLLGYRKSQDTSPTVTPEVPPVEIADQPLNS